MYKKRWYSPFVRHYLKFYCCYPEPEFRRDADKTRWEACGTVLNGLDESNQAIIRFIFENRDTMEDNILACSQKFGIGQDEIYEKLFEVEGAIAKELELI